MLRSIRKIKFQKIKTKQLIEQRNAKKADAAQEEQKLDALNGKIQRLAIIATSDPGMLSDDNYNRFIDELYATQTQAALVIGPQLLAAAERNEAEWFLVAEHLAITEGNSEKFKTALSNWTRASIALEKIKAGLNKAETPDADPPKADRREPVPGGKDAKPAGQGRRLLTTRVRPPRAATNPPMPKRRPRALPARSLGARQLSCWRLGQTCRSDGQDGRRHWQTGWQSRQSR